MTHKTSSDSTALERCPNIDCQRATPLALSIGEVLRKFWNCKIDTMIGTSCDMIRKNTKHFKDNS